MPGLPDDPGARAAKSGNRQRHQADRDREKRLLLLNAKEIKLMDDYEIKDGVIVSPGKFEGEAWFVPELWDLVLQGFADEYELENDVATLFLTAEDHERFGLPSTADQAWLFEDDNGFVSCVIHYYE